MGSATIQYDVPTTHWPTESTLVKLDPPLRRYDVIDGSPRDFEYVIVHIRSAVNYGDNKGVDIFPSTKDAEPVHDSMVSHGRYEYGAIHTILKAMGYKVTN